MAQVTGIGGVFIQSKGDPKALGAWYLKHLGVKVQSWGGAVFRWSEDPGKDKASTAWLVAGKDSDVFNSAGSGVVINYRVDDLETMIANLRKSDVTILKNLYSDEQGKFASILDLEGNRVELWEPVGT